MEFRDPVESAIAGEHDRVCARRCACLRGYAESGGGWSGYRRWVVACSYTRWESRGLDTEFYQSSEIGGYVDRGRYVVGHSCRDGEGARAGIGAEVEDSELEDGYCF